MAAASGFHNSTGSQGENNLSGEDLCVDRPGDRAEPGRERRKIDHEAGHDEGHVGRGAPGAVDVTGGPRGGALVPPGHARPRRHGLLLRPTEIASLQQAMHIIRIKHFTECRVAAVVCSASKVSFQG